MLHETEVTLFWFTVNCALHICTSGCQRRKWKSKVHYRSVKACLATRLYKQDYGEVILVLHNHRDYLRVWRHRSRTRRAVGQWLINSWTSSLLWNPTWLSQATKAVCPITTECTLSSQFLPYKVHQPALNTTEKRNTIQMSKTDPHLLQLPDMQMIFHLKQPGFTYFPLLQGH